MYILAGLLNVSIFAGLLCVSILAGWLYVSIGWLNMCIYIGWLVLCLCIGSLSNFKMLCSVVFIGILAPGHQIIYPGSGERSAEPVVTPSMRRASYFDVVA